MAFTTLECKQWLVSRYPNTNVEDWKRISKYLDDGVVTRKFRSLNTEIIVQESDNMLIEKYVLSENELKQVLILNRNLHYIDELALANKEFKQFSNINPFIKKIENEFLAGDYELPYFFGDTQLLGSIQKELVSLFVYSVYDVSDAEISIEISDIYGICGGDGGQTVSLITEGSNGLICYLESFGYEISGTCETCLSIETDDYIGILQKIDNFGLVKFTPNIHVNAVISQEPYISNSDAVELFNY